MNRTTKNIHVYFCILYEHWFSLLWDKCLALELLAYKVSVCFISRETAKLFSRGAIFVFTLAIQENVIRSTSFQILGIFNIFPVIFGTVVGT